MYGVLIGVIILVAVLLILVVLAQNSKGGGLSSQFGGAGAGQLMGVKKTTDLLERLTWGLAIGLVILTLSTTLILNPENQDAGFSSPNVDRAQDETVLPSFDQSLPDVGTSDENGAEGSLDDLTLPDPGSTENPQ